MNNVINAGMQTELVEVCNPGNDGESCWAAVTYRWQKHESGKVHYTFVEYRYFPGTGSKKAPKWLTEPLVLEAFNKASENNELGTDMQSAYDLLTQ